MKYWWIHGCICWTEICSKISTNYVCRHIGDAKVESAIPKVVAVGRDGEEEKHWILTVVKPEEELVYFFDPVRRRLPAFGEEWTSVVNSFR
ncbi:hypothetical protein OROGR_029161 [Orobanche gracilis]